MKQQTGSPRVSVLMAAYNAEKFLDEAIQDILRQTYKDFEFIIVEDGSTDGTLAKLRTYAAGDPRILVVENTENRGLPVSLNIGLEHCRAPIVARADADDRYMPDRLQQQLAFMDRNPQVGLLSCAVEKIDENGTHLLTQTFPREDGEIRIRELFVNCISHPGAMFRRDLVLEVGGYDPAYRNAQDADLWLRLRRKTKTANLRAPLVKYRKHGASAVQTRSEDKKLLSLGIRQRALAEYLGRDVGLDEAAAMVDAFWFRRGHQVAPERVLEGLRGLQEVWAQARLHETNATVRFFRRSVSDALVCHARGYSDRALRLRLLTEAVKWHPATAARQVRHTLWRKTVGV
ncbi:O-antigen biosynthesis glycosyltransferase WbnJ [Palleronia abyssalis]|uniref:O-antigen biosynthesis glycosyltransferase WbnJ n=2 Tax=Palleronia abyssalis TaxID=1501240 RepID=A0A2R8C285_9RHOB|nr:O-antigen biosynthesis glycosyltransferase WbnJ [Palleronia abyssalis]